MGFLRWVGGQVYGQEHTIWSLGFSSVLRSAGFAA